MREDLWSLIPGMTVTKVEFRPPVNEGDIGDAYVYLERSNDPGDPLILLVDGENCLNIAEERD